MHIVDWLSENRAILPVGVIVAVAFVAAVLESALGLVAFVPAGPILIVAAASVESLAALLLLAASATAGTILGDRILFRHARARGSVLREGPLVARLGRAQWDAVVAVLQRSGPFAAFLARLVPTSRRLTAAAAGSIAMPAARMLQASAISALATTALYVVVGVLMRASYPAASRYLGVSGSWIVLGLVVAGLVYLLLRLVVLRLPSGDPRRVLGDTSAAGSSPQSAQPSARLRDRLFADDEWRTVPNAISALRIVLLPVFGILLVADRFWSAIVVLLIVFVTDFVDGFVARRFHQTSALGAWLDPIADRLTVVFVVAAFAASGIVPWQLVVILLIPDLLSGTWAVVGFNGSPDVRVSKIGKARTALLFVGLFLMLFGEAIPGDRPELVGVGFALFVVGTVGHYLAMARNARGLVTLWQRSASTL